MLDRLEAQLVQRLGRGLELVDLVGGEGVAGLLVPVGLAVHDVVVEAELLELALPAGTRGGGFALHGQLAVEPCSPAEPPKPPRWLGWDCVVDGAVVVLGAVTAAPRDENGLPMNHSHGQKPMPPPMIPGVQEKSRAAPAMPISTSLIVREARGPVVVRGHRHVRS